MDAAVGSRVCVADAAIVLDGQGNRVFGAENVYNAKQA